jgi:hypothetical protein
MGTAHSGNDRKSKPGKGQNSIFHNGYSKPRVLGRRTTREMKILSP